MINKKLIRIVNNNVYYKNYFIMKFSVKHIQDLKAYGISQGAIEESIYNKIKENFRIQRIQKLKTMLNESN
jgi:hypothetical protein